MTPYNAILKLNSEGLNHSEIADTVLGCSRKTVIKVLQLAEAYHLPYPLNPPMTDLELHRMLHPKKGKAERMPDRDRTLFLLALPGYNLTRVRKEYDAACEASGTKPYSRAMFQNIVSEWKQEMPIPEYRSLLVFQSIRYAYTDVDGKKHGVIFAEVLFCHMIVAEIVKDGKQRSWVHAIIKILKQLGSIPDHYCFLNRVPTAFRDVTEDCLSYYGLEAIDNKAAFGNVLKEAVAETTAALNKGLAPVQVPTFIAKSICSARNDMPWSDDPGFTRNDAYNLERNAMKPLTDRDYDLVEYTEVVPQLNYHVEIDGMYYSVPFENRHDKLVAYISENQVEIYCGVEMVAVHSRLKGMPGQYKTVPDHLVPDEEIPWGETSVSSLISWANKIGPTTTSVIENWIDKAPFAVQAFKKCSALLHMASKYGSRTLEEACKRATEDRSAKYRYIVELLKTGNNFYNNE
ncbi:Mu transposase domain-containing protein [Blautia sp. HCP28S3_G10]|uniref:Mu transposase domain-containing protein n=1 Tax=Blautia sp. HCP28S3_G10 TaxID=3438908 RepID=UPI003F896AAD